VAVVGVKGIFLFKEIFDGFFRGKAIQNSQNKRSELS
jgi:hypothetical protein